MSGYLLLFTATVRQRIDLIYDIGALFSMNRTPKKKHFRNVVGKHRGVL